MTNKFAIITILRKLKENNLTIRNMKFFSSYFIFSLGYESVCHFRIKGCPGWKFGIWIDPEPTVNELKKGQEDEYVSFFAQYEQNIDKFKPSRSYYCKTISRHYFDELLKSDKKDPWGIYYILRMIEEIKHHPIIAYYNDLEGWDYLPKNSEIIKTVLGSKIRNFSEKFDDYFKHIFTMGFNKLKTFLMTKSNAICEIEFIDKNQNGWRVYPRYQYNVVFQENSTEAQKDWFVNFWFEKRNHPNIRVDYFVEVEDKKDV